MGDELSSEDDKDNDLSSRDDDDDDNDSLSMSFGDEDYHESDDVFFDSDEEYSRDSGTSSGGTSTAYTAPNVSVIHSERYVPLLAVAQPVAPLHPPIRRIPSTTTVTAHPVPITIPSASPQLPLPPNHLFTNAHHPVSSSTDTTSIIPTQANITLMSAPPTHPPLNITQQERISSTQSVNDQSNSNFLPLHSTNNTFPAESTLNDIDFDLRMASAILSNEAFPTNLLASDESHSLPPLSPRFTPSPSPKDYLSE